MIGQSGRSSPWQQSARWLSVRRIASSSAILVSRSLTWLSAIAFTSALAAILICTGDLASLADTTVALLLVVFAIVNISVLVLRREPVEHEHFVVPSAVPVIGVGISLALLTQVEGDTYVRAALLVALGAVLWVVNWLIVRRQGPPSRPDAPATAPPTT